MSECSKCGKCCKVLAFTVPHTRYSDDELRYFKLRGVSFERIDRNNDYMIVPCRCSLLGADNLCTDFENRPDVCRKVKRRLAVYKPSGCTDE